MSVISSHIISNYSNLIEIVPQDQRTRAQTVSMFSVNIAYSRAFEQHVQNPTGAKCIVIIFKMVYFIHCTGAFITILNLDLKSMKY